MKFQMACRSLGSTHHYLLFIIGISFALICVHALIMDVYFFFLLKMPGFTEFIQHYGYIGILLWFLTFDQVTPLPEEISLLIIGYLCTNDIFSPVIAAFFCLAGFIIVDIVYYYLARTGNKLIKKRSDRSSSSWVASYKNKLKEHMAKTIAILVFIPRMRMWAPILAGSMKLPVKKFLLFDAMALVVFTVLYLSLGIIFHNSLAAVMAKLKNMQHIIFFGAVLIIAVIMIVIVIRRKKKKSP